jgi:hypothetical protein
MTERSAITTDKPKDEHIKVYLRVRPNNPHAEFISKFKSNIFYFKYNLLLIFK